MTIINVDDDRLLEAHDRSETDSLEETIDRALQLYAELENPDEMLPDDFREEVARC